MPTRTQPQIGLGRAIRQLRDEAGLRQAELALEAGLTQTWISHLESGRVNPQWGTVQRIAEALDVPLDQIARLAAQLEPTG